MKFRIVHFYGTKRIFSQCKTVIVGEDPVKNGDG
jgi:hypothetical protein